MIKKRFLSMLVLLAAVVTGAWAQWTGETYTATANEDLGAITVNADATLTINEGVTVTVTGGINVASGTLTVTGPGTLVVTGAKGNDGGEGTFGGNGGNGGAAISGNIIVEGGATVTATGGTGGNGGRGALEGGSGGKGGNAFAGTLTYKSGTVTANGGSGGSGGWGDDMQEYYDSGSAGKAFANEVDFSQTNGYNVTNGTSLIVSVLDQTTVVISGGIPATVPVMGVMLSQPSATLTLGETETVTLTVTVEPDNATDKSVTWSSSDETVATVSNEGVVTAKAAGTATITVTATNGTDVTFDDQTATCTVTVAPAGPTVVASGNCGTTGHESEVIWSFTDDGTLTISGTGAMTDFANANAQPWKDYRSTITSVVVEEGVTTIGTHAFRGFTQMTSVSLPEGLTSIGERAFNGDENASFTTITFPSTLTSIGNFAFGGCSGLTSVTIGNSVTSIGYAAFIACSGLTSVTIGNSVTSIGGQAFAECSALTSITIPNSVTSIGRSAFSMCAGLTSPVYNDHVFAYLPTSYSGTYTIPDGIESIAGGAFSGCSGLTSITIPNSVTSIGESAFGGCSGLTSPVYNAHVFAYMPTSYSGTYTIPDGIESIGEAAFYECTGLTSITIPNSVTSIGNLAFRYCSNLETVTILAESLESYGTKAFQGTAAALKIYVPAGSVDTYKAGWAAYADQIEAITVAVTGVTLLPTTATLTVGETETLTATVLPGDATDKSVTWSSSDEAVATVSNEGVVTAVAAGEATITVTATNGTDVTTDDQTATCTVTVADPTYTVSLKEGTDDATSWKGKVGEGDYQSLPLTGLEAGTAVSVKYNGTKKVKSVKAKKKAADPLTVPLTMEALTDGTIEVGIQNVGGARRYDFPDDFPDDYSESRKRALGEGGSSNIRVKYSVNGGETTTIYETTTETTTIPVNAGDKVQFYGDATSTQFHGDEPKVILQGTAQTKVYGNIMSLLDEDNYATLTTLPNGSFANFAGLFSGNENLTDASGLLLPATTTVGCYYAMFAGCTSLTTAPALPATELAEQCYIMMFFGCTSLTTAPALPATELAGGCYYGMFMGCTSLNSVTCMATDISADDCAGWLEGVATTGTFTKASGSTWPEGANGIPSGWTVNEQ